MGEYNSQGMVEVEKGSREGTETKRRGKTKLKSKHSIGNGKSAREQK